MSWRLVLVVLSMAAPPPDAADPEAPWLAGRLEPEWAGAKPRRMLRIRHDAAKSDEENGEALADGLGRLEPGDRLEIGPGRYSVARKLELSLRGTAEAPIWIVAGEEHRPPVITRPDARQNVLDVGGRSRAEYLCLRGLELTGGSTLIRFHDASHIWLDRCHLHHAGHEGITTNTRDTSRFFITRNHFHHFTSPGATGEAMYLGGNHGEAVMSTSVIAGNHVHDCGGTQGDGIELKQGSHHNWIVENHVHDTKYPCIIAYGTGGNGINLIERNVCYRSGDNVLQVQGEAIVRNNLLIDAAGAGFASTDHQGKTRRLEFVHNTVVSRRRGANLSSWNDREEMVFANNIVYTDGGDALRFPSGSRGVTVAGNVIVGRAGGVEGGFVRGTGLEDFEDVTWDGAKRNAVPRPGSAAASGGDERFRLEVDLTGRRRGGSVVAGAHDVAAASGEIPFTRVVIDGDPPADPWYKMRGDIDGDGDEDVLIGGRSGPLVVYEHPGWRKSLIAPGGWSGVNGETGDIDRDGDIDVVMGGIVWFRNPRIGGGSWAPETVDSFQAHDIELGDLDGDGKLDIAARDQSAFGGNGDRIHVYGQIDPSSWSRRVIPCPHGEGLKAADLDRDGDLDIVIGARWYENDGRIVGGAWTERVVAVSYTEADVKVETADLNGDGRLDVILAPAERAGEMSRLSWFEAPPDPRAGGWTERAIAEPAEAVHHSLAAGDLDGDGDIDIATAEMHQGKDPDEVSVHRNPGGGSWREQVVSSRGSHDILLADIGADGDLDIVGANWSGDHQPIELWENGSRAARAFAGSRAGDEREVAGIELCWCPPGRFLMGSPAGEPERRPGEDRVEVTLTKGFWMGKYETTQGQWKEVAGRFPGKLTAGEGDDFPVYAVNFAEAEEFSRKLTERARGSGDLPEGWEFRLPTEAQWEYACRAGTTTATSFGDKLSSRQVNFQGKPYNGAESGPSLGRAARVGSYPANPWGLHDMHGNVFEWCRDWYHLRLPGGADPDLRDAKDSATRSEHGDVSRVRRGGCWADEGWPCRSAFRLRFEPERRHDHIGFRIVLVRP